MKKVLIVEDPEGIRSMMQLPLRGDGEVLCDKRREWLRGLKTLPARRFNFIIADINSLKLISFVKSNSSHTMQAVVE